ncbi:retrotransposon protein, putative, ty1-copia subclass [Tanacetum coccineum]|uniref:Retrotransposon protein, putative, ty1-copia subclass n=1 Tax=Tanacetum coccineum TaxID=301880 RepID=A0ABQ4XZP2_9ASTR
MQIKERFLIPTGKKRPQKESPIVDLRERLNMKLHLQAIQRKQCASTATQRGIRSGLKESRRLKHGELNLVMGNRKIMLVTRIGKYELMLKSGDGYKFSFDNENGDILVYSNGCFIFKASPYKGIYETNSRLGHVNKKRIAQLQKNGVLESFDFKSDDVCESCLLGKMTKSPFMRSCKRGEGSLDLVHTDCVDHFDLPQKMEMLLRYGYW